MQDLAFAANYLIVLFLGFGAEEMSPSFLSSALEQLILSESEFGGNW